MKRILLVFFCFCIAVSAAAETADKPGVRSMKKTLIVYYSLTDKTHVVAQTLAAELNADIRRVEDVTKPSVSWWFYISAGFRAKRGKEAEIKPIDTSFQGYDRVFVGSPVWGGSPSTPINAFIAKADFTGKNVVLFMTMGGDDASGALKTMSERITKKGGSIVSSFAFSSKKATNEELATKTREIAQRYR